MTRRILRLGIALMAAAAAAAPACGGDDPLILNDDDVEICGLVRPDGRKYCIDAYEASRPDADEADPGVSNVGPARSLPDRQPWVDISWSAASAACEARERRLCDIEEWVDACDGTTGPGGTIYAYGDTRMPENCNLDGGGVVAGGSKETCTSTTGTFDQSGNVWEWVGNTISTASARGGGFRSSQTHGCQDVRPAVTVDETDVDLGFRCCRSI